MPERTPSPSAIIAIWPGPTAEARTRSSRGAVGRHEPGARRTARRLLDDVRRRRRPHRQPPDTGRRPAGHHPAPNAHRVLQADGTISPGFRWPDPARTDDPRELLRAEGVEFDRHGRANPAQRIGTEELAQLGGHDPGGAARTSPGRDRATRHTATGLSSN